MRAPSDRSAMAAPSSSSEASRKQRMRSKSYGDDVVTSLGNLRTSDELCDFTVCAEGKSVKVHKILLAATSDYFRAMLMGPMKESKEDSVDLKGITADALQNIVDFIYSGEMELDHDNLYEILNAASHLQIQTALDLCSEYMISKLTFADSDELLSIADTYSLAKVTEFYNNKVLRSFEEFSRTEQFLNLPATQLARYLASDSLRICSEHLLYDLVGKWYAHEQKRREHLDTLLQCVRYGLMSEVQLQQLQQHWLTGQHIAAMSLIADGLKYHTDASMGHPWVSTATKLRSEEQCVVLVHQGSNFQPFEVTAFDGRELRFYQMATDISSSRDCRIASVDNFVYIARVVDCGGGTLMNSLLRFDPRHLSLQELTPCRRLRIDPSLASKERWLYIFGGTNENYAILDSVECYDVRSNTWVDLRPLPTPTHSQAVVVQGESIYLSGGVSGQERQPTAALVCYNPTSHQWLTKASMHCARRLHEMTAFEDKLFTLGGIGSHNFHQQTQIPIECYDTRSDQWTILTSTLAGRSVGHFIHYQGKILSVGREHYEATEDDIWTYDIPTDVWKPWTKAPRRTTLAAANCTLLYLNLHDEKVAKRLITDRR